MAIINWRLFQALEKSHIHLNKAELAITSLLLIAGGIVFGIGLASFEVVYVGFSVTILGAVALLGGILLTNKTFNKITDALLGTGSAVQTVNDHVDSVERTVFRPAESNFNPVNTFERQFDGLKTRVEKLETRVTKLEK